MHQGNGFILAETGGAEEITLTVSQIPSHTPSVLGDATTSPRQANAGRQRAGTLLAGDIDPLRRATSANDDMSPTARSRRSGGSQPHANLQPYLCINFIISLFGIFPSPT